MRPWSAALRPSKRAGQSTWLKGSPAALALLGSKQSLQQDQRGFAFFHRPAKAFTVQATVGAKGFMPCGAEFHRHHVRGEGLDVMLNRFDA